MFKNFHIIECSLIADLIQGFCFFNFIVSKNDFDELSYYQAVFQVYLNNKKII